MKAITHKVFHRAFMMLSPGTAASSMSIPGHAAAEDLALLPEGSAGAEMRADDGAMRDQARTSETPRQ
jgi:hypothetical protein